MSRRVFLIVCVFSLQLPATTAIQCYVCENEQPLCHDPFEPSSGFAQECPPNEVCFKKMIHGSRLQTAMLLNILYHDGDNTAYVAAMFPTSYRAARRYAPTYRGGSTSVRGRIRSPHSCGGLA